MSKHVPLEIMVNFAKDERISIYPWDVQLDALPEPVSFDLAKTALVVVDMQNDFLHIYGWFARTGRESRAPEAIVPKIAALASAGRSAGLPVIWVNWCVRADALDIPPELMRKARRSGKGMAYGDPSPSGRGRILVRGDWGAEIIGALDPDPADPIVYKRRYTGFHQTELDTILRGRGIETLFFTGINTDRCVYATLTDASALGYGCVLIEDACATLSSGEVSNSILFLVRLLYGATATSDAVLAAFGHRPSNKANPSHKKS